MRAAGVRHRVHAGHQREEAGKSGTKGEGQVRKVQAPGVPGQEEGPQHTQDIQGSENRLLDYPRLAAADARPRTEGQVQREAPRGEEPGSPSRSSVPCGAGSRGARKSVTLRPARGRWTW